MSNKLGVNNGTKPELLMVELHAILVEVTWHGAPMSLGFGNPEARNRSTEAAFRRKCITSQSGHPIAEVADWCRQGLCGHRFIWQM